MSARASGRQTSLLWAWRTDNADLECGEATPKVRQGTVEGRLHMAGGRPQLGKFQCCCCRYKRPELRQGTIEGRRDVAGGRLASDRRAAVNRTSGQCFTSLAFSADGAFLLAGGASKCAQTLDPSNSVLVIAMLVPATCSS